MDKRYLRGVMIILAMLMTGLAPLPGSGAQKNHYTVLIDPAHGGDEAGVTVDKLREKDLNLNLALMIRQEAQKGANFEVQLTRSTDRTMTVSERSKAVGVSNPDCLLILHVNAGFGKKAAGYEVYFPGFRQAVVGGGDSTAILKDMEKNSYLNDSVRLAQKIQASLETVFPRKGRGLRDAPSPLLDALTLPGLIVEVGFATQTEDRKKLTDEETQKAVARALVRGLRDYFQKAP
ncbi:MAG: N-acetylmuramoyl-L-alanine amidase [Syntrophales bacterium]|nr:N-acetylmuramoyl-L-alanine amidase [Syntrophales bacterium]